MLSQRRKRLSCDESRRKEAIEKDARLNQTIVDNNKVQEEHQAQITSQQATISELQEAFQAKVAPLPRVSRYRDRWHFFLPQTNEVNAVSIVHFSPSPLQVRVLHETIASVFETTQLQKGIIRDKICDEEGGITKHTYTNKYK